MPRLYSEVQCIGYNSLYEVQERASKIIEKWQKEGFYAEVHYAINNGTASILLLKYKEE